MELGNLGAKVRELRRRESLTQKKLAERLGISPSYLNLIEHGKRPLTAALLIKLASEFNVDLQDFASTGDTQLLADLMQIFDDPLFEKVELTNTDVRELATTLPAVGRAVVNLYRTWQDTREAVETLASHMTDRAQPVQSSRLPGAEVTDLIQRHRNYFHDIERAAESIWRTGVLDRNDLYSGLVRYLESVRGVKVKVVKATQQRTARRYDPETRTLYINEVLRPRSRHFQLAWQIGMLEYGYVFDSIAGDDQLTTEASRTLARIVMGNYFAGAVLFPYEPFLEAARETRYDIELLGHRFRTSFEQVCHRLTTLQRPGMEGVPFHLVKIDIAGNISKRFSVSGMRFARYAGACPRWNVSSAFLTPGRIRVQVSEMPDGKRYFCLASTLHKRHGGFRAPETVHAVGLGCSIEHAHELTYADGIDLGNVDHIVPIGVTCRLCERRDCDQRAFPSLHQKLRLSEHSRGVAFYGSQPED